jgi:hypothetical protein
MTRLGHSEAVRPLKPARRALTGRVTLSDGARAGYESSLERDWLFALDFDWRVRKIQEQPYTVHYTYEGQKRRYTPDVLAEFDDGKTTWTVVYEVKAHQDLRDNWAAQRPRYKAAVKDCRLKGWKFRIVTERDIRTPYVENIKFLRRYRSINEQMLHQLPLLTTLHALGDTTPQALIAATWQDPERQMAALPELWRLVAHRRIAASLLEPLTMATKIWMP